MFHWGIRNPDHSGRSISSSMKSPTGLCLKSPPCPPPTWHVCRTPLILMSLVLWRLVVGAPARILSSRPIGSFLPRQSAVCINVLKSQWVVFCQVIKSWLQWLAKHKAVQAVTFPLQGGTSSINNICVEVMWKRNIPSNFGFTPDRNDKCAKKVKMFLLVEKQECERIF